MQPLHISHFTATSCLGAGLGPSLAALQAQRSGLRACDFDTVALDTFIGRVDGLEDYAVPSDLAAFDCRNNRLAAWGLEQDGFAAAVRALVARVGAARVGVFMGTSTAGILQTELAYRQRDAETGALPTAFCYEHTQNPFSVADFVRRYLGIAGPAISVSTACSSSAKVFASAQRMLAAGLIDAAVVGGVDSLCLTTLYGFHSLGLLSPQPCTPFDAGRSGISIGEAAAFAVLQRPQQPLDAQAVMLLGVGESSDAHHMSSPHPQGLGAQLAMAQALRSAGLAAQDMGYVNLHGTATPSNDAAEALAMNAVFGDVAVPCSSTKGATGHTLGAAGAIEAVFTALALQQGQVWGGANTQTLDPQLHANYVLHTRPAPLRYALTNSFGFGGTNSCLVMGLARSLEGQ